MCAIKTFIKEILLSSMVETLSEGVIEFESLESLISPRIYFVAH